MLDFLRDTDYAIEIQIHPCGKMRWRNSYVSFAINIYIKTLRQITFQTLRVIRITTWTGLSI